MKKIILSILSALLLIYSCTKDSLDEENDLENEKIRISEISSKWYYSYYHLSGDNYYNDSITFRQKFYYNQNNQLNEYIDEDGNRLKLFYNSSNKLISIANLDLTWENEQKLVLVDTGNATDETEFNFDKKNRLINYINYTKGEPTKIIELNWEGSNSVHYEGSFLQNVGNHYWNGTIKYTIKKNPYRVMDFALFYILVSSYDFGFPPYDNFYLPDYWEEIKIIEIGSNEKAVYRYEYEFNEYDYPTKMKVYINVESDGHIWEVIRWEHDFHYEILE